jgi:hypothetical protein
VAGGTTALRAALVTACRAYSVLQWLSRHGGATRQERAGPLPGDDLVGDAQVEITRAATLPAPPSEVWPWLMQVGWGRGGWYTPRWVDRVFFPANGPSAVSVLPGLRDLVVGDLVPDGPPDAQCVFVVAAVEHDRHLVLHSTSHLPLSWRLRGRAGVDWSWTFDLRAVDAGRATRLVFRWRSRTTPLWLTVGVQLVIVPADWGMSRGMLRGLGSRLTAVMGGLEGPMRAWSEAGAEGT